MTAHIERMLKILERAGELDNTIVVATSDNGMAFPRAKGNLYEYGVHMPLAMRWGAQGEARPRDRRFRLLPRLRPHVSRSRRPRPSPEMTGRSLMPLLVSGASGQIDPARDFAVFGIERHFPGSRPDGAGYPVRAIRTRDYLYIRNLTPDRNPVGDTPGPLGRRTIPSAALAIPTAVPPRPSYGRTAKSTPNSPASPSASARPRNCTR